MALPFLLGQFRNEATRLPALAILDRLGARLGPGQTRQLLLKPVVSIFEVRRVLLRACVILALNRMALIVLLASWLYQAGSPEAYQALLKRNVLTQLQTRFTVRDVLRQLVPFVIESLMAPVPDTSNPAPAIAAPAEADIAGYNGLQTTERRVPALASTVLLQIAYGACVHRLMVARNGPCTEPITFKFTAYPAINSESVGPVLSARFISGVLLRRMLTEGNACSPSVIHTLTALGTQFGPAYITLHYMPAIAASLETHCKRPTARTAIVVPNVLLLLQKLILQLPAPSVSDLLDEHLARPLLSLLLPLPANPKLDAAGRTFVCRAAIEVLRYVTHTVSRPTFEKKVAGGRRQLRRSGVTDSSVLTIRPVALLFSHALQVLPLLQAFFIRFTEMFEPDPSTGTHPAEGGEAEPSLVAVSSMTEEEKVRAALVGQHPSN